MLEMNQSNMCQCLILIRLVLIQYLVKSGLEASVPGKYTMAISVVEFSKEGYKIRKVFG